MGTIIGFLVTKGLSEKMARVVAMGGLFLLILAAVGAGKCAYDRSVIAKHEAKQAAATAKADRKADAHAAEQRRVDDARLGQERNQLEKVQANAKTDLDRRLAKHRCLRLQQAARAEGREPPACD